MVTTIKNSVLIFFQSHFLHLCFYLYLDFCVYEYVQPYVFVEHHFTHSCHPSFHQYWINSHSVEPAGLY